MQQFFLSSLKAYFSQKRNCLTHLRHMSPLEVSMTTVELRWRYTVRDIVFGTGHCFGTVNIFVISQPKWLKFGLQAHFLKVLGHTQFQLYISYTFKVTRLLVMYLVISTNSFITLKVQEIESWNLCVQTPLENVPGDQISVISV